MTVTGLRTGWTRRKPGWAVIARKEFADHILSVRFVALLILLSLVALSTVYTAAGALRDVAQNASGSAGLFLRLFTVQAEPIPLSFMTFLGFLAPILGIAFGFDAINNERAQGTLSRLVSQPIHRDDVINGKVVAGLGVVGLLAAIITSIVAGLGIVLLGITPEAGEVARIVVWMIALVAFVGVWLAFAVLCSTAMRRPSTAALVAIGVWLVLTLFGGLLAQVTADALAPVDAGDPVSILDNARLEQSLSRVSPIVLYEEAATALLNPETRTLGLVTFGQIDRALVSDLSLQQSLLLVWPQLVGLIATTIVIFAIAYVVFMRQEVRA